MFNARRKAIFDELMKIFGKSVSHNNLNKHHSIANTLFKGENLNTEDNAITISQILLMRAGLSADQEYPRESGDKANMGLNKALSRFQEFQFPLLSCILLGGAISRVHGVCHGRFHEMCTDICDSKESCR